MLIGLGGSCLLKFKLERPDLKKENLTAAQVDHAFDYIQENAPLAVGNNQVMRWIFKEKNNPESPVYTWPESKLEKAIHNLMTGKALCKINDTYPLCLKDFKNWVVQQVVVPCIKASIQHCIVFAGVSGIGLSCFLGNF